MMSAPLSTILASAATHVGCKEEDIRLGFDDLAYQGLGIFGWLAGRCSFSTKAEIASYSGRPLWTLCNALTDLEVAMQTNPDLAERLSDIATATLATATMARRRDRIVEDQTPQAIASRLILPGPAALTVGSAQLRALAAAYLSLIEPQEVV